MMSTNFLVPVTVGLVLPTWPPYCSSRFFSFCSIVLPGAIVAIDEHLLSLPGLKHSLTYLKLEERAAASLIFQVKDLSVRWYSCSCGTELDRDTNSAKIIL